METNAVSNPQSAVSTSVGNQRLAESFDTFLVLLTTQMKNQDPLSPMDSGDFTQQIVQMTGVEQQLLTNDLLKQLVGSAGDGVADAVSLIGKQVRAATEEAALTDKAADWIFRLDREAQFLRDMLLDARIDIGEGADRAGNRAGRDFLARILETLQVAVELGIGLCHLETESHRLGMDTMRTPNAYVVLMGVGLGFKRGKQLVHIVEENVAGLGQLDGEAGIQNIGRRHALMYETRLIPDIFREIREKGDHVMLGFPLDLVNPVNIEITTFPDGLRGGFGNHAQFGLRITGMGFNLVPNAKF